jgi:hypothetical protein
LSDVYAHLLTRIVELELGLLTKYSPQAKLFARFARRPNVRYKEQLAWSKMRCAEQTIVTTYNIE